VKTICGSDEPHLYPVISFAYHNEQVRVDEVQRVIVYNSYTPCLWLHQQWLTLMHSCITATNMVYYCLPRRHNGGGGICLHSFIILAIKWRSEVNSMPWPLYPKGRIPYPLSKRLGGPTASLDILEERRIACLYWGPKPVSCSLQHSRYSSLRPLSEQRQAISTPCRVLYV